MSARPRIAEEGVTRTTEPFIDLRRYGAIIRKRRRWFVGTVAITMGIALGYWLGRTPTYVATSRVLVKPVVVDPQTFATPPFSLETEAAIVRSTEVTRIAADDLGQPGQAGQMIQQVSVDIPPDAQALDISFVDTDPGEARRGAQAYADAYLAFKAQEVEEEIARVVAAYDDELSTLEARLAAASETLASSLPESEEARTAAAIQGVLEEQIATLSARRALASTTDVDPGEVIVRAARPESPTGPSPWLVLALGVLLGVFLGTVAAFARERIGDPLSGRAEIEDTVGAPVLSVIPRDPEWRGRGSPMVATMADPVGGVAEAYRALRASLLAQGRKRGRRSSDGSGPRNLLVVSPLPGDGKSTTAANLGVVLAQAGHRVLLVSADLRRPRLHEFFGFANRRGLSMVLRGQPLERYARRVPKAGDLWFLSSGPPLARPSELIRPDHLRNLLTAARENFEYVIIDCPPLLPVADSRTLASEVDGVLLVVDPGRSGRNALNQASGELQRLRANVVGVVLSNVDPATGGPDYIAYGYAPPAARTSRPAGRDGQPSTQRPR
jgi:capsular exopolysaccharide synthesis family protein